MRDFIVARSWRTFDKQQVVALAEICRLISFHRKEMNKAEIHINVNNPNPEMQELARKIVPENIKLFFYDNQFLEDYKSIGFLEQSEVDFLRSKGYAVPYMEYSVEDLISFGWVLLV